jgi:hypothetical protein
MLQIVISRLRAELEGRSQQARREALEPLLLRGPGTEATAAVGTELHLTEDGVKSAVHRVRRRFRELFQKGIANTVATRTEIEEELRYLLRLMTSRRPLAPADFQATCVLLYARSTLATRS